mgnify:CR=1 FL=1
MAGMGVVDVNSGSTKVCSHGNLVTYCFFYKHSLFFTHHISTELFVCLDSTLVKEMHYMLTG